MPSLLFFLRRERPVINTRTVDLEHLKTLPVGTLGKEYSDFLTKYVSECKQSACLSLVVSSILRELNSGRSSTCLLHRRRGLGLHHASLSGNSRSHSCHARHANQHAGRGDSEMVRRDPIRSTDVRTRCVFRTAASGTEAHRQISTLDVTVGRPHCSPIKTIDECVLRKTLA